MTSRARELAFIVSPLMLLAGCFSEHADGTTAPDVMGVCNIPVAELLQGQAFVPVRNYDFLVDTLRVRAGTTVTWFNCEAPPPDPHTVTSDAGAFDSPYFGPGETHARRFDTRGTFPYHCTPHPFMRAVVIVE